MAKIAIEFDTQTKQASATIDGKAVVNLSSVSLYPCCMGDGWTPTDTTPQLYSISVQSCACDDDQKMSRYETVYASEEKSLKKDIHDFFNRQKNAR